MYAHKGKSDIITRQFWTRGLSPGVCVLTSPPFPPSPPSIRGSNWSLALRNLYAYLVHHTSSAALSVPNFFLPFSYPPTFFLLTPCTCPTVGYPPPPPPSYVHSFPGLFFLFCPASTFPCLFNATVYAAGRQRSPSEHDGRRERVQSSYGQRNSMENIRKRMNLGTRALDNTIGKANSERDSGTGTTGTRLP